MRTLRYSNLHPLGHFEMPTEGTVVDLLFDMPWVLARYATVPTLDDLNELFREGSYDAGMSGGCEWEPFEIDTTEYNEIVRAIRQRPLAGLEPLL